MREDQVQNAVKFLSHPKVRGSPVMYRRSFLERKGLTKEEIDEAFRRVPDPTPAVSSTQTTVANQEGQLKTSSNIQPQPVPAASAGTMTKVGYFSQFHWSHAVVVVGVLAASGAGTAILFKKTIIPRLKSWIRKVVLEEEAAEEGAVKGINLKPSLAEEAAVAAKAAAAAAADVARASQEMLASKTEEKKYFKELTDLLNYQVQEMKSMTTAIQRLEGPNNVSGRPPFSEQDNRKISVSSSQPSQQFYTNGKVDTDARSVRSSSPPTSVEPSDPPHPKSYTEIMEMVQRGERPSNIRDINDQPPNPHQPIPEPLVAPKPKPWEVGQTQNSSSNFIQSQGSGDASSYGVQDNNQFNGSASTPWWQRKNARATEIESEDEQRFGGPSGVPTNERAPPRSWVPPQPPPVAMAESAAAIRQPKKSALPKDQLTDDQLLGRSSEISDDLQRITKISESGGVGEANGVTQTPLADDVPALE
nr:peroxisomal membrane protein PEX14-like isoform X1 [Ipomoea batatas]